MLLHDIQARGTVAALPRSCMMRRAAIASSMVVPATPELPKTATEPQQWRLHSASETGRSRIGRKFPDSCLPAPRRSLHPQWRDSDWRDGRLVSLRNRLGAQAARARLAVAVCRSKRRGQCRRSGGRQHDHLPWGGGAGQQRDFRIQEKSAPASNRPWSHQRIMRNGRRLPSEAKRAHSAKMIAIHAMRPGADPGKPSHYPTGLRRTPLTARHDSRPVVQG